MAVNKVEYNGSTLIDLTSDTVTAASMLQGTTAHDKSGNLITGTMDSLTVYSGTGEPSASLGSVGDVYLVLEA